MEFWVPKGRKGGQWKPAHAVPVGNYRTWRKVKPDHSHADKLTHSIARVKPAHSRSKQEQCERYCQWARDAKLVRVATYRDDWLSNHCAMVLGLLTTEVDPADIIGPAHEEVLS